MPSADIGLIGLAVMGQNLILNMNDHNYTVAVYNRTVSKVDEFLEGPAKGSRVIGTRSLKDFFAALKRPRKVMLMVKAGEAVDTFIESCLPYMEKGDIFIDGGNSHYADTDRRCDLLKAKGLYFIGAGISGGEEGARNGPSIMPGGHFEAWEHVRPLFQDIAAKADGDACCEWVGAKGAGHYVKMVHNGIEYGDMQLICEAYHLMKNALGLSADELHDVFTSWNHGELNSYLIEITARIFSVKSEEGTALVEKILDIAGQKGTGKWTGINAFELGIPLTLIGEAVFARCLSAMKEERVRASKILKGPNKTFSGDKLHFITMIREALYASKIISYTQGYQLMREASKEYSWNLDYGAIALMWRGGCIIRSQFLGKIKEAYDKDPKLENLLLTPFFSNEIHKCQASWREVIKTAVDLGISTPCFSSALAYFDGYRSQQLPANLLQAQRDLFGAHTYERIDAQRGQFFHTEW